MRLASAYAKPMRSALVNFEIVDMALARICAIGARKVPGRANGAQTSRAAGNRTAIVSKQSFDELRSRPGSVRHGAARLRPPVPARGAQNGHHPAWSATSPGRPPAQGLEPEVQSGPSLKPRFCWAFGAAGGRAKISIRHGSLQRLQTLPHQTGAGFFGRAENGAQSAALRRLRPCSACGRRLECVNWTLPPFIVRR